MVTNNLFKKNPTNSGNLFFLLSIFFLGIGFDFNLYAAGDATKGK